MSSTLMNDSKSYVIFVFSLWLLLSFAFYLFIIYFFINVILSREREGHGPLPSDFLFKF
jgi:hypothetical protein